MSAPTKTIRRIVLTGIAPMSASKTIRRVALTGIAILASLSVQLALEAGQSAALTGYGAPTFFGAPGSGNGQFAEPTGVAVEESSGDVYVVDQGNSRVEKFDAEGGYLSQFSVSSPNAIAVDDSPGPSKDHVYVVDSVSNTIHKFTSTGTPAGELTGFASTIYGVAVDTSGHVWVVEESGSVRKFTGGEPNVSEGSISPPFSRNRGIALDSEENLYLTRGEEEPDAVVFNSKGEVLDEQVTICGCVTALTVDHSTNDLFADEGNSIARYKSPEINQPPPLEKLEGVSSSKGIAVNATTHTLYASQQQAGTVAVFKFVLFPDVTTGPASEVHRTTAKLEGEVNPDGQAVTSCQFEYGTSQAYGQTVACTPAAPGSGTSPVPVAAEATSLTPQTTYHYRLVAGNSNGTHAGTDQTFTASSAVQGLQTLPASNLTGTTGVLNGSFESTGLDTHYLFEYGTSESYGSSTLLTDGGSGTGITQANTEITALLPNQAYHYRIVAENNLGKTNGEDVAFRTMVPAPLVPGEPSASFVKAQSAILSASVNPEHAPTRYHFEYGACPVLSECATVQTTRDEVSSVYGVIGSTQELAGLLPQTTYRYRLVASNELEEEGKTLGGTTAGTEGTFTTSPAPAPSAETGAYNSLTPTSAIITGMVNPDGLPASYTFELGVYNGLSTQYGVVFSGSAGNSSTPIEETFPLTGLQPGTTYAYRISILSGYINNETHTINGQPITLTTTSPPTITPPTITQLPIPNITFPKTENPQKKKKKKPKNPPKKHHKKNTTTQQHHAHHNKP